VVAPLALPNIGACYSPDSSHGYLLPRAAPFQLISSTAAGPCIASMSASAGATRSIFITCYTLALQPIRWVDSTIRSLIYCEKKNIIDWKKKGMSVPIKSYNQL